ncbi:hypothetical protein M8J77_009317 [Diaphorina citri]|nr:hypothetical protein M8J77_009317 [Diaphorina citri]
MIPNEEILKRTNMMSIENLVRQRRMRWAGHLSRMSEDRTPLQVAFGELKTGLRPQQNPKKRWIDLVKHDFKEIGIDSTNWRDLANNRELWRKLIWEKTDKLQTESITKAEARRIEKHEDEDQYTWTCPLCSFTREGRKGRQYVNSHLSQKHQDDQSLKDQNKEKENLKCRTCNILYKTRAGLRSHMRSKHPNDLCAIIQPIKRRKQNDLSSQITTTVPPNTTTTYTSTTSIT